METVAATVAPALDGLKAAMQGAVRLSALWNPKQGPRKMCHVAQSVGLAPARRGEPGYHNHLDADGDGLSCEPLPRR